MQPSIKYQYLSVGLIIANGRIANGYPCTLMNYELKIYNFFSSIFSVKRSQLRKLLNQNLNASICFFLQTIFWIGVNGF